MKTTIEITLTEKQWAQFQRDPNVFQAHVWEAESSIQSVGRKWGGAWEDIVCRVLSPEGALIREVTWVPLAQTRAKARGQE